MRRILIAGCGYVGQAAADLFHEAGWEVEGWTRTDRGVSRPYPVRSVDISDTGQVRDCAGDFDFVIHCASTRGGDVDLYRRVYLEGTRNLLEGFPGSRLLFTSSTSVYAQTKGEWVTEESETRPARATSQILLEAESLVLDHDGIVARLAGIYGPGRSALLKRFLDRDVAISIDRFVNQVHRDDVASAFFHLLGREQNDRIFNVADNEPIRLSECYRWLGERLDLPVSPSTSPALPRKRGDSNKRVSNSRLRASGWNPRYPSFAAGMEKSVLPARGQIPI